MAVEMARAVWILAASVGCKSSMFSVYEAECVLTTLLGTSEAQTITV